METFASKQSAKDSPRTTRWDIVKQSGTRDKARNSSQRGLQVPSLLFATRAVNLALTATRTAYVGQIEVFKGVGASGLSMYGKRSYYSTRRDQRQGNLLGSREKALIDAESSRALSPYLLTLKVKTRHPVDDSRCCARPRRGTRSRRERGPPSTASEIVRPASSQRNSTGGPGPRRQ